MISNTILMVKSFSELAEKLLHPSDVENKIDSILKNCKEILEAQNSSLHSFYDGNFNKINEVFDELEKLKDTLTTHKNLKVQASKALSSSESGLKGYNSIKALIEIHENFVKTKNFMKNFENVEEEIPKDDLITYHNIIYEKEDFLYEMEWFKTSMNADDLRKVELKIAFIQKAIYEFKSVILKILADYIENADAFEKINHIVRREEARDKITVKSADGVSSNDPVIKQYYIENKIYSMRQPQELLKSGKEIIASSIKRKFEILRDDETYMQKLPQFFDDLKILKKHKLYFFTFDDFLLAYHSNLKSLLSHKLSSIPPEYILRIIEFKNMFYDIIADEYGKDSTGFEKLIENEDGLLNKYSQVVAIKLTEWIDNITIMEVEKFKLREKEMNKDEQNKLISSGFINLMQIIKVQLEPASHYKKVFERVMKVLIDRCDIFMNEIIKSMAHEYKMCYDSKGLNGFEDYCIMFGNSGFKIARYFNNLEFCDASQVRKLQSLFIDILKAANSNLCDFIMLTCKPVINKLFTEEWDLQKIKVFIITLDDFLSDYVKLMTEYSFETFLCDICEKIYMCYKTQLKSSSAMINSSSSTILKSDYSEFVALFSKFTRGTNYVDYLKPLLKLIPLLETSGDIFLLEVKGILLSDGMIDKKLIENIANKRTNLTAHEKTFILQSLGSVFKKINDKGKIK